MLKYYRRVRSMAQGSSHNYFITIYKLTNNLEETDRKDLILRRKGETKFKGTQEKLQKGICLKDTKK